MNQPLEKDILFMGLPNTCKTTFLAALWYLVQHASNDCFFAVDKVDGNLKYINQLTKDWVQCKQVPHTTIDSEKTVSMRLKDASGRLITLNIPDLSGECFSLQWSTRQFTKGYDELLKRVSGALLFLHPGKIVKPIRIDSVNELADAVPNVPGTGERPKIKDWDQEKSPTQVKVIELLQLAASRAYFKPTLRLGIIVSAWDLLGTAYQTPEEWLQRELPMLQQFLEANSNIFEIGMYGVSAQGAEYVGENRTALFAVEPIKKIKVVGKGVGNDNDLTTPLQWLMS